MSATDQTNLGTRLQNTDEQDRLFIRNLIITVCLLGLGAFVTVATIVTILVANNINVLSWLE